MPDPKPDQSEPSPNQAIAALNDAMRKTIHDPGRNQVVMTRGIWETLGDVAQFAGFRRRAELLRIIRDFEQASEATAFSEEERDMGWFTFHGHRAMWKIDYYDRDLTYGSQNPTDPEATTRVLTIMLVSEY